MSVKSVIKTLLVDVNPLAKRHRAQMRKQLTNMTPSFLCPNCIGGILFHDLGLEFRSPTVNLMLTQTDFLKFVLNMEHYLESEFVFYKHLEYECPCAYLDEISIQFTHYHSRSDAVEKWRSRAMRIDSENTFVFLAERDGLTEQDIRSLGTLNVRGLMVFTANAYPDIPYAVQIGKYKDEGEVGNILKQSYVDASREYENYFDFVKWFNEANGAPYDVTPFVK